MSETVGGFFIGWDVGAWYCDDKKRSQDSVVILDGDLNIVGSPWRGNLRESLNNATSALDWILTVHRYCEGGEPPENTLFTIAIDTPLGFSEPFLQLSTCLRLAEPVGARNTNP